MDGATGRCRWAHAPGWIRAAGGWCSRRGWSPSPGKARVLGSGVHAAELDGVDHTLDGEHERGDAERDLVLLGHAGHVVEGGHHDVLQALVHFVLAPEIALAILDPLETGDSHASGVRQDVGD